MVLEATMIVLDTSEYMRNGDYLPNRFLAEQEAAQRVFRMKTRSNPESVVGLMNLNGDVKTTLVHQESPFLHGLSEMSIHGTTRFSTALQVAALALKHRQNKSQRQRVVVFVGSPISDEEQDLVRLAKRLKKNNVAVDVVNFGQEGANITKLHAFSDAVNGSNETSVLVNIPPGPYMLSDDSVLGPILYEGQTQGSEFGNHEFDEYGMDEDDPALVLAMQMSLEEERQRQAAAEAATAAAAAAAASVTEGEPVSENAGSPDIDQHKPKEK